MARALPAVGVPVAGSGTGAIVRRAASRLGLAVLLATGTACASGAGPNYLDWSRTAPPEAARPQLAADYDVLLGEIEALEGDLGAARSAYLRAAEKDPGSAFVQKRLAELAAKQADLAGAVRHATRAIELDPEDVESRIFVGRVHRNLGNLGGARSALLKGDGAPLNAAAGMVFFQMLLERNDLVNARALAEILAEDPDDPLPGQMALATVNERMGQYEKAEVVLREALAANPDRYLIYGRIARLRRAAGDRKGEIALYEEVLDAAPAHYGTLVSLAEAMVAADDVEGAVRIYERVVEEHPGSLDALRRLSGIHYSRGRYELSIATLGAGLETHPDDPELLYALGQVRRGSGDRVGAIETFASVPIGSALYPDARLQLATIYEEQGDYRRALAEVEAVRSLRPSRALDFHTAALYARLNQLEAGLSILEALGQKHPDDAEILYQMGVLYGAPPSRLIDAAIEMMLRVLEIDPDHAQALNFIAYSWVERGENLDTAERMIRRALELRPNDGYILDSLGWVYYMRARPLSRAGRHGDAQAYLEQAEAELVRAAELTGGDPVVSEHLGDVYLLLEERERALEFYEEAVGLEVRPEEQPDLLEKLDALKKELDRP